MRRKIAIIIGSNSDLLQCHVGLHYLSGKVLCGECEVTEVVIASIHRNMNFVLEKIASLVGKVDVLIVGAGWANALTGIVDSYLRNELKDTTIPVVGVAFEDKENSEHSKAALLSIIYVPGTQVVFKSKRDDTYFLGPEGFEMACEFAATGELPQIVLKDPKPFEVKTFYEALFFSCKP